MDDSRIAVVHAVEVTPEAVRVYDPDQFRDTARAVITYWLLGLITLLVACAFAALYVAIDTKPTFAQIKEMVELLLGPLVALVSAATGFYFGAQSAIRSPGSSRSSD